MIVLYAPVGEQIGGWNIKTKARYKGGYIAMKQSIKVMIAILSGRCSIVGGIFCQRSL